MSVVTGTTARAEAGDGIQLDVNTVATVRTCRNEDDDYSAKVSRAYKVSTPDSHDGKRSVPIIWSPQPDAQYEFDDEEEEGSTSRNEDSDSQMTGLNP